MDVAQLSDDKKYITSDGVPDGWTESIFRKSYRAGFYTFFGGALVFSAFFCRELLVATPCAESLLRFDHLNMFDALTLGWVLYGALILYSQTKGTGVPYNRGGVGLFAWRDWQAKICGIDTVERMQPDGESQKVNYVVKVNPWFQASGTEVFSRLVRVAMWFMMIAVHIFALVALMRTTEHPGQKAVQTMVCTKTANLTSQTVNVMFGSNTVQMPANADLAGLNASYFKVHNMPAVGITALNSTGPICTTDGSNLVTFAYAVNGSQALPHLKGHDHMVSFTFKNSIYGYTTGEKVTMHEVFADNKECQGTGSPDLLSQHTVFWYTVVAWACIMFYEILLLADYLRPGVKVVRAVSGVQFAPLRSLSTLSQGLTIANLLDNTVFALLGVTLAMGLWQSYDTLGPGYCSSSLAQEYQLIMVLSAMLFMHHAYKETGLTVPEAENALANARDTGDLARPVQVVNDLFTLGHSVGKGDTMSTFLLIVLGTQMMTVFDLIDMPCSDGLTNPSTGDFFVGKASIYFVLAAFLLKAMQTLSNIKSSTTTVKVTKAKAIEMQPVTMTGNVAGMTGNMRPRRGAQAYTSLTGRTSKAHGTTTNLQFV